MVAQAARIQEPFHPAPPPQSSHPTGDSRPDDVTIPRLSIGSSANSNEKVELAELKYRAAHLVKGADSGYDRQRGGLGAVGGSGEKAIETQRRQLRDRTAEVNRQLKVQKRNGHDRTSRQAAKQKKFLPAAAATFACVTVDGWERWTAVGAAAAASAAIFLELFLETKRNRTKSVNDLHT